MLTYSYYPFKTLLDELAGDELFILRDVAEGWYIDYKTKGLKIADYAKYLAAFANQYGGWLIIGVGEKNDGSRTAETFFGIKKEEVSDVLLKIREAASAHVSPEVLYEEKIIDGPVESIGLPDDCSIIIIGVPKSFNTPHIHSSGRIYRRIADQSKPKEETDRFILDELWKRGNEHQQKMIEFLTRIPKLPKYQSESSWAYIFFKPSESQSPPSKHLEFNDFASIVTNLNNNIFGVHAPMQSINTTANGYVARQIQGNNPGLATLTIRWWHNGCARLDIPINTYELNNFLETHEKNKYAKMYYELANRIGYTHMNIADYSILAQAIASLSNCYLYMLNFTGDMRDIYSCFTLKNVFYTSPYLDSRNFIERASQTSLPLIQDENIIVPREPTERNMFLHSASSRTGDYTSYEEHQYKQYIFSATLTYWIFKSVGLVVDEKDFSDEEVLGFNKVSIKQ